MSDTRDETAGRVRDDAMSEALDHGTSGARDEGAGRALLVARGLARLRRDSEREFRLELPLLRLRPGDRLALLGESGSGKSTLISLLALAVRPDAMAEFRLDGTDIGAAWERGDAAALARVRAGAIAYVPQRDGLMEFLTVEGNIRCAATLAGARPDIAAIAEALGLLPHLGAYPARLSGGQRQRASVACALARAPRLILADEPTAALDPGNAARVMTSLCGLAGQTGAAIVFATHQRHLAEDYGFALMEARLSGTGAALQSTFGQAA